MGKLLGLWSYQPAFALHLRDGIRKALIRNQPMALLSCATDHVHCNNACLRIFRASSEGRLAGERCCW